MKQSTETGNNPEECSNSSIDQKKFTFLGNMTGYRLDIAWNVVKFHTGARYLLNLQSIQIGSGTHQGAPSVTVKRLGCETDKPSQSSAKVKSW
jgi:hypothetical protein